MKYAVRIISGWGQPDKLFAVCTSAYEANRHYNLAKASLSDNPNEWVNIEYWTEPGYFNPPQRWEFSSGPLFP